MNIRIKLEKDRRRLGEFVVVDEHGEVLLGPLPCIGRADTAAAIKAGNPTRDPLKHCGNTPTGKYKGRLDPPFPATPANLRSYGPLGTIVLLPIDGQALEAEKNGRSGIRMHAGALGPMAILRPTDGCIRTRPEGQEALVEKLGAGWTGEVLIFEEDSN